MDGNSDASLLKYDVDHGKMRNRGEYCLRVLSAGDKDAIAEMVRTFLTVEPICSVSGFSDEFKTEFAQGVFTDCVLTGSSLGMFHKKSGALAGMFLGQVHRKGDIEEYPPSLQILTDTSSAVDLYRAFNIDRYFDGFMALVAPEFQRQGIQGELFTAFEYLAEDLGCKLIASMASSAYTYKNCIKFGYEAVHEIKYAEYVSPHTGTALYQKIPPPHLSIRLMVKQI